MTVSGAARHPRTRVVVVGNGMVGSRFVDDLLARDGPGPGPEARFEVTVLGAEAYEPYNRVLLSEVVAGKVEVASLALPALVHPRATVHRGAAAARIDRARRVVHAADGSVHPYDALVLATGSSARIPAITGLPSLAGPASHTGAACAAGSGEPDPEKPALPRGVHALRTLDDAREIVAASVNARRAVVIGAGVLGLEVACGLARRGLAVSVVHGGPSLMDRQLDPDAGAVAAATLTRLGVAVRLAARTTEIHTTDGHLASLRVTQPDGEHHLPVDLLVLACGTIPETHLAADAGLPVDRGIVVDDVLCSPGDRRIFAIGDCAQPPEGGTGLIAQGWDQSRRLADHLAASAARTVDAPGAPRVRLGGVQLDPGRASMALRLSMHVVTRAAVGPLVDSPSSGTALASAQPALEAPRGTDVVRLKAAGLDVVTMGVCGARRALDPSHRTVRLSDPSAGRHVEVVVAGGVVVGATCVGAPQIGADLTAAYTRRTPVPADPAYLLLQPVASATTTASDPTHMPDRTTVCRCNSVTKAAIVEAWHGGARSVADVAAATRATTGCGGCTDVVCGLVDWLGAADPAHGQDDHDMDDRDDGCAGATALTTVPAAP